MAVPILKLNLVPPPTLWRQHHRILGWACLIAGSMALVAVVAISLLAYREAIQAGKDVVLSTEEAKDVIRKQLAIQDRLRSVDVEKELPVWRLAERILSERGLPWSRLTAELERSMVQDVRLKSIQRTRNAAQSVDLKIRGEARSRTAEEAFVTELQKNPFFTQVILERESDRQGGGVEFEYTLSVAPLPPPFASLPKYGPVRTGQTVPETPKPSLQVPRPVLPPTLPTVKPAPVSAPSIVVPPPVVPDVQPDMPVPPDRPIMPALRRPARMGLNPPGSAGPPSEPNREEPQ
jgi:hypothetical protein